MGSKKTTISIVNQIKPIMGNLDKIKSKKDIGLFKDAGEEIIKVLQQKILEEEKYKKKDKKLSKDKNVKSATMDFLLTLRNIEFPKEVQKGTTRLECTPEMEDDVKDGIGLLIKAIKDFAKTLTKQTKWYRKMWGHTSLLATEENIKCLEDLAKKLEELCSKYTFVMPKGLPSGDNRCYMNSAIQQLYKLKDFREKILKFNPSSAPNEATDLQRRQIEALQKLFKYLHGDIKLGKSKIASYEKILGHEGHQEDSSEKMREIIDNFKPLLQPSKETPKDYITDHLILFPDKNKSIEDLFLEYFTDEKSYKKASFYTYTLQLNSKKFIIYLNRTNFIKDNAKSKRVGNHVNIGEKLEIKNNDDLFKFVDNSNKQISNPKFELTGVTIHDGSSVDCGHYFVYQKSGNRWICKNDSHVSQKSWKDIEEDVCTNATVLIYKLR